MEMKQSANNSYNDAMDIVASTPSGASSSNNNDEVKLIPDTKVTTLRGHSHEVFICAWSPTQPNVLASGYVFFFFNCFY